MPNLTIEYTSNLPAFDTRQLLAACNRAMAGSGHFQESDIKSRALGLDCYQVGAGDTPRGFVHVRVALLAGRSEAERKGLAEALLAALLATVAGLAGGEIQLSVETADLDRASYAKAVVHG